MRVFKDKDGREWTIEIAMAEAKRVKDLLGFQILNPQILETMTALSKDIVLLMDVICCLCRKQLDGRKMADADLWKAMDGDPLEQALLAIRSEIVDFFPSRREGLMAYFAATDRAQEKTRSKAIQYVESGKLEIQAEKMWNELLGNSPASSGSTPDLLPSDNST